jgi:drug/metabolite transporter (DMT)-like permease
MEGVVFGLASALCWGVADFCVRFASRAAGSYRALFYTQLIGLAALSLVVGGWATPTLDAGVAALGLGLGLLNVAGALFLYRAFSVGVLAVVSPISASGNAVAIVIALLAGERPTAPRLIGIAVTTLGVLLVSTDPKGWAGRPVLGAGVGMAVAAAGCFGVSLWASSHLVAAAGAGWTTWGLRVVSIVALAALALPLRRDLAPPSRPAWRWLIPVGLFDVAAYLAYNAGVASAYVAVVAVLSSLFSAVTVLLAWLVLRERLAATQWLGIGLILGGVTLVGLPID